MDKTEGATTTEEAPAVQIPSGYMEDSLGRLVPDRLVKDSDRERDGLVRKLAAEAADVSGRLTAFRKSSIDLIDDFVARRGEEYGAKMEAGDKGSQSLSSYDGRLRIQIRVPERTEFDEGLQIARKLISECLKRWGRTASPKVRTLVHEALRVDKKGQVDARRMLGLRKLDMDGDEQWKQAMEALSDAARVVRGRRYVRVMQRTEDGKYESVPLSVSGA